MVKHALLVVVLACNGEQAVPRVEVGSATVHPADAHIGGGSAVAEPDIPDVDKQPKREEPEHVDPGKQLVELGAVPAWQAVVDRAQYLERRHQKGVVYGTLGSDGSDGSDSWLVDETEGNGALAIRVKLRQAAKPGDRIAVAGAWAVDDARHWFWDATSATALPAIAEGSAAISPIGHAIASGSLPAGARPISKADDGSVVYFTLAGAPPVFDGDGWPVGDELGNPVAAILNLPGEHASYGAQDLRSPDERWTLKRGQTYWVRVGVVHKHGADKPLTTMARTPPVRVN